MAEDERRVLLPRPARRSDYQAIGVSPGGYSWHRKISEQSGARSQDSPGFLPVGDLARPSERRLRVLSETREDTSGDVPHRRPFHYSGSQTNIATSNPVEEAQYRRVQYYNRLQNQTGVNLDVLSIPDHVLPVDFYQIHFLGVSPAAGKQSSIVTIFAIWNTMMGTSLLSMPWALEQAGLVMGLLMMAVVASLCLYTAYRILQVYDVHSKTNRISEFNDLCGLLLGPWAQYTATIFSILAIVGAAIVYWVLLSNFLFSTVSFIHDNYVGRNQTHKEGVYCPKNETTDTFDLLNPDNTTDSEFDKIWGQYSTVPLFLILILFPLVNLKSATFFTKFNALGTVSIMFILSSVLFRCYEWGINVNFSDQTSEEYIPLVKSTFPSLTGILTLALFIHNAIITIMSNNRHQENNGRDMTLAYILVTTTYMLIGGAFYVCFPLPKFCIEDNLLNNFHQSDVLTVAAKIFLFFQMMTVFPLIMYLLRVSVLFPIYKNVWPGFSHILVLNSSIIAVCVLFAIFMPNIGTVLRFSGAACGLTIIFALPIMVYLASKKREGPLSKLTLAAHSIVVMFGVANFVAQFFI